MHRICVSGRNKNLLHSEAFSGAEHGAHIIGRAQMVKKEVVLPYFPLSPVSVSAFGSCVPICRSLPQNIESPVIYILPAFPSIIEEKENVFSVLLLQQIFRKKLGQARGKIVRAVLDSGISFMEDSSKLPHPHPWLQGSNLLYRQHLPFRHLVPQ